MSKVLTKRLSRGIRLTVGHVLGQLQTVLAQFTTPSIDLKNLDSQRSTFRLNFHVPVLKGIPPEYEEGHLPVWIPFVLPPTQEFFTLPTVGEFPTLSPDYPRPVLQEISVSFDQRAEAAAISAFDPQGGGAHPNAWEGLLNYEAANRLDVNVSLYEKEMLIWTTDSPLVPEDRLLSFTVPAIAYMDTRLRLNPTSKTDLNQAIDPSKSYLLEVSAPDLTDDTLPAIQLNSLLVSLKFEQQLLQRDTNPSAVTTDVQNIPTSHDGEIVPPTSTIALPAKTPERVMATADFAAPTTGIQTAFETIDGLYRKLLRGGYNDRGDTVTGQTILTDAGYEVIAVPLFGNGIELHSSTAGAIANPGANKPKEMPWDPTANNFTYDMRRIPIRYPFVIHHVVAALNWTPGIKDYDYTTPVEPNFNQIIGVGIGTGLRSDRYGYAQVALAEWRGDAYVRPPLPAAQLNTKTTYRIDRYNENLGNVQKNIGFDLLQVPLVGTGGVTYPLYDLGGAANTQGKPFYVGKTPSTNSARTPSGLTGQEQWLEVRWKLEDSANQMSGGAWKTTDTIIGRGGHWVFIIGKKHLA